MVSFPTWILDCDSQSPSFLDILLASDTSVCCTMACTISLYWKFLIMLLSQFLLIVCQTQNGMPCFILNSCDGQDGLCDHLRNVTCDNIFKCSAPAASEYCEWVQVGIDVYVYIISIRSSLTHLHSFQLLLRLP